MGRKKVSIDVEDGEGTRYHTTISGSFTQEKVRKIFELMNIIDIESPEAGQAPDTVGGRIWGTVDRNYPLGNFTSSDILEKYEDEYRLPIKLSVISTYLARFAERGRLYRERRGREWSYRMAAGAAMPAPGAPRTPRP
ncbi:MAG: hypothetical protein OXU86_04255 [Thaumarchaeota archaeon]|nr:hypothetical protein [Nitrososphaerota archaeon]RNJ72062.1 MAG: hypothetical protein EB833_05620 [Thaumarchaeota archaeon S13]RNJ74371.1 MAG: hypothetical protein EB824_03695 [Thaumarchaeota archaeon S15]